MPEEIKVRDNLSVDRILDIIEDDSIPISNDGYIGKLKLHTIPMTHPCYNIRHASFIGRFENYATDYATLAESLGLPTEPLHMRPRATPLDYQSIFKPHELHRAKRIFDEDCQTFKYKF